MIDVIILGAGGHTRSLITLLETKYYSILGIYDDNYNKHKNEFINSYKLIGRPFDLDLTSGSKIVLSFGDNFKRRKMADYYKSDLLSNNLKHSSSIIEKNVCLGNANQIFAKAYMNSNVIIGNGNIINTGVNLEHEVKLGDYNHIAVGASLCGRVTVGNYCFIGAGSVVIDRLSICDNVIVGANSLVINNIKEPGTYVGNPVRKIK